MQAVILAAGMGKRLKELTKDNTKCMVKVGERTLIERLLSQLDSINLDKIIIVTGYKADELISFIKTLPVKTPIAFIDNPIYDKTNNIYSLSLASKELQEDDTLLFESDIIFEDVVLKSLIEDKRKTLALVAKYESWMDGTCVKLNDDDEIIRFISKKDFDFNECSYYYKTVNIYKFSKEFSTNYYVPFLNAYLQAIGKNEYYEQVLNVITMLKEPEIKAKRLEKGVWYEIDDVQDLDIASVLFADDNQKINLMHKRFGGFWRFPSLIDFCYLVNPFYPPKKMVDEIKANFETLLREYPSGQNINSLLASKNFNVKQDYIAVGNGAAELIKVLMSNLDGATGFIRPTFEEYPNRCKDKENVVFTPSNKDYSYTAEDLINFYNSKSINNLIVINPDNPSGSYINRDGIAKLIKWASDKGINLIIDESFADFASEEDNTLIKNSLLESNKNLYVVKSISKSYGVPGLRLGIIASADKERISKIKKDVSIWNINSFAEFYMQIEEKYAASYKASLNKLKTERNYLYENINKIKGLRAISSEANYLMVELTGNISAKYLEAILLSKYGILIKNLSSKVDNKEYLRIAVRDRHDNNILLTALKEEL